MKTWAAHLYGFYTSLHPEQALVNGVQWLYPQRNEEVLKVVQQFLQKYFNDSNRRTLMLGINPGRFGAGVTGVNFTAAKQLTEVCGISHPFKPQSELSAEFIYAMIDTYGGPKKFYSRFFIGSVCPLGFVKGGKNINYYDDKELQQAVKPFIIESIEKQLTFPVDRSLCLCIGGEKNYKALSKLNEEHRWFGRIVPLPHPRFIMQYRRKHISEFIKIYLDALEKK
ncbi:MAG TPA: uracil-DNA glycosylase family protein [Flavisolibacter sp.]|nr:uracil-DNA glycosylase family protein [Flavisolibacter sp.]